jgi:hypothetical protein
VHSAGRSSKSVVRGVAGDETLAELRQDLRLGG